MTRYSKAQWRPLATKQGQPAMAAHDIVCLHTMVGNLTGTDRMFHLNGWKGTESHFGIGGKWGDGLDGVIYQWQDTEFTADANLDGNHHVISIETGDNAPADAADIEPWTPKQLDAIVAVITWACRTYNIPAVLIPDSKPGRRGIGYHRLGVQHSGGTHPAGFLQPGGELWSTAVGKQCPGDARIAQLPAIVARVKAALAQKEDDMLAPADIEKIAAAVVAHPIVNQTPGKPDTKTTIGGAITNMEVTQDQNTKDIVAIRTEQAAQRDLLTEILARLPAAPTAH